MFRIAGGIVLLFFWSIMLFGTFIDEESSFTQKLVPTVMFSLILGAPGSWLLYDGIRSRSRRQRVIEMALLDSREYQEVDLLLVAAHVKISPVTARQIINQAIVQGIIPHNVTIK